MRRMRRVRSIPVRPSISRTRIAVCSRWPPRPRIRQATFHRVCVGDMTLCATKRTASHAHNAHATTPTLPRPVTVDVRSSEPSHFVLGLSDGLDVSACVCMCSFVCGEIETKCVVRTYPFAIVTDVSFDDHQGPEQEYNHSGSGTSKYSTELATTVRSQLLCGTSYYSAEQAIIKCT